MSNPDAIDTEGGRVRHRHEIQGTPEQVWAALTTPSAIADWWGHPADFPDGMITGASGTFRLVTEGQPTGEDQPAGEDTMPITIVSAEPHERLEFWWGEPGDPTPGETASRIVLTLTPDGTSTLVEATETLPSGTRDQTSVPEPTLEVLQGQVEGWTNVLGNLDSFVRGRTV